jgi:hypothetical protein
MTGVSQGTLNGLTVLALPRGIEPLFQP